MDVNTLRVVITVLSMAVFLGITWWAYSSKQTERFKQAENLPFADDDVHDVSVAAQARAANREQEIKGDG